MHSYLWINYFLSALLIQSLIDAFILTPITTTTTTTKYHKNLNTYHNDNDMNNTISDDYENNEQESRVLKNNDNHSNSNKNSRRSFLTQSSSMVLTTTAAASTFCPQTSNAADVRYYVKDKKKKKQFDPVKLDSEIGLQVRSIEEALLNLLPIKNNKVFARLQQLVQDFTYPETIDASQSGAWETSTATALSMLDLVDTKRSQLEPAFNEDDSTILVLTKAELGEVFIEEFRTTIVALCNATQAQNSTAASIAKTDAAVALSEVGELLVEKYPYDVPKEGKFSYLPRLLGRTRITFLIKRPNKQTKPTATNQSGNNNNALAELIDANVDNGKIVGNVTIIADGFAAPITAGNFVDLCSRGFYTGLPVKLIKKRLGLPPENEDGILQSSLAAKIGSVLKIPDYYENNADINDESITQLSVPVLGSFQEGFYDPLTAKPRRIPIEILRTNRKTGELCMSYWPFDATAYPNTSLENDQKNKPVITFDNIPNGLVALNHPDRLYNLASSEIFALQSSSNNDNKDQGTDAGASRRKYDLLTGQYTTFGYVINNGMDVIDQLLPGDVISDTIVSDTGLMYLVKIRQASFPDLLQGDD